MDPLTITSTVISLSARCVTSARALYELREKYKDASMTITAIYSEANVLSTSLAHIQGLCTRNPEALRLTLQEQPELESTFDQALTGCVLIFSVLDEEIRQLYEGINQAGPSGTISRIKYLWKEEAMNTVLTQIRGQQSGLSLLIQALQMSSIHELRTLLQANMDNFQNAARRLGQFRHANPRVKAPNSVFELRDDIASLYSVDSTATSTNFIFDDLVVSSQAYRRALAQSRSTIHLGPIAEQSEHSSDSETVVERTSSDFSAKYNLPASVRSRLSATGIAALEQWLEKSIEEHSRTESEKLKTTFESTFGALQEKYKNVKRLYFHLQSEKEERIKEQDMLAAEYSRVVSEKTEFERENGFLQNETQRLRDYFEEQRSGRKLLTESHMKELHLKDSQIEVLKNLNEEKNQARMKVVKENEQNRASISKMEEEIATLKEQNQILGTQLESLRDAMAEVANDNEAKDLEIQRYKGFEAIIEQLKTLSPTPSSPQAVTTPRIGQGLDRF